MSTDNHYFVSYAQDDNNDGLVDTLMERLSALSKADPLALTIWSDQQIKPGEFWPDCLNKQMQSCTAGLLLLSPQFLASSFIREVELPELLDSTSGNNDGRVVPMLLRPIPNSVLAASGLDKLQYFSFKKKSFIEMKGNAEKDKFVIELYSHLVGGHNAAA